MNILKNVWNWVVFSSAYPDKISLTLKALIPFLVMFNVVDPALADNAVDGIVTFVTATITWATAGIATFGLLRKVFYSIFPPRLT